MAWYLAVCLGCLAIVAPTITNPMGWFNPAPAPVASEVQMNTIDGFWKVSEIKGLPVPEHALIRFQIKGTTMSGSTDCNSFEARLSRDGKDFATGPMKLEPLKCTAEAQGVDADFFGALQLVDRFSLPQNRALALHSGTEVIIRANIFAQSP